MIFDKNIGMSVLCDFLFKPSHQVVVSVEELGVFEYIVTIFGKMLKVIFFVTEVLDKAIVFAMVNL